MIPTPWPRSRRRVTKRASASASESDEVGSSSTRILARAESARAISTNCWVRHGELRNRCPNRPQFVQAEGRHQGLGVLVHARSPQPAEPRRLPPEIDILGNREVSGQRQLLVDDADAELIGVGDAANPRRAAVDFDRARLRHVDPAEDFDQRRLARPVFTQQGVDLAAAELEIHAVQGRDRGKPLSSRRGAST